jgi:thioredoxin-like negative regulator of GroEL
MKAALQTLETKYTNVDVAIREIDTNDKARGLAREYGINAVPTTLVLVDAEIKGKLQGAKSVTQLETEFEGYLQSEILRESPGGSTDTGPALLCSAGAQGDDGADSD